jgi:hypothetical protein
MLAGELVAQFGPIGDGDEDRQRYGHGALRSVGLRPPRATARPQRFGSIRLARPVTQPYELALLHGADRRRGRGRVDCQSPSSVDSLPIGVSEEAAG